MYEEAPLPNASRFERNLRQSSSLAAASILFSCIEVSMPDTYSIAIVPGDGTGPEVIREGKKVLESAAALYGFALDFNEIDIGGERYLRTGEILPESLVKELGSAHAIYLGAIGHPQVAPGILEKGILLRLRFELDLYVNLRPVKLYPGVETPLRDKGPEHIDFVVVRENTEGFYVGSGGFFKKGTRDEMAIQESINTRKGIERLLRYSFDAARARKRKKLTLCGREQCSHICLGSVDQSLQ